MSIRSPFRLASPKSLQPTATDLEKHISPFIIPSTLRARFQSSSSDGTYTTKRDFICFEILTTEASYLRDLKIGELLFKIPLTKAVKCGELGVTLQMIEEIFGVVENLFRVNKELFDGLLKRFEEWSGSQKIGDVINTLTPFLKMYKHYTEGYEKAVATIKTAEGRDANFKLFISELSQHPSALSRSLSSFIILPVQRIPRYVLLLQDLIKNTPENHPDYSNLVESLENMKNVASYIDLAIEHADNRKKVIDIHESLGNPVKMEPHRRYITEAWHLKQNRRGEYKRKKFYLFSDILLYAREDTTTPIQQIRAVGLGLSGTEPVITESTSVKFSGSILLRNLTITDVSDVEVEDHPELQNQVTIYRPKNGILFQSPRKSFNVYAETKESKDKWMNLLESSIKDAKELIDSKNDPTESTAAIWVPDNAMKQCPLCWVEFTIFVRRHHCRKCGILVCANCSRQKMLVKNVSDIPVRVCNTCLGDPNLKSS